MSDSVEDIATERLAAIAAHHGWSDEQCIWRIFNALARGDEPFDLATLIWGIDFVGGEERGPGSLDPTLPRNRENDALYAAFVERRKGIYASARRSRRVTRSG
jgi:hypothetical protein